MDNVKKANKITEELIELINKGKSDVKIDDYPELNDCINSNPHQKQLFDNLSNSDNYFIDNSNRGKHTSELLRALNKREELNKSRRLSIGVAISSIAAAVAVVSFLLFYIGHENNVPQIIASNDISIDKPTLILSSGEDVDLTQLNKDIVLDNHRVEKSKTNELSYSKIDKTKSSNNIPTETNISADTAVKYNTVIVPSKYTYDLVLEDGTQITLNAGSEFKFPVQFSKDKREVFLKGEAYFKVVKNANPFIVVTDDISVKVYGTDFNVNTNGINSTSALLVSGSVGVTINDDKLKDEVLITPSTEYVFDKVKSTYIIKAIDVSDHLGWLDNYFSFTDKSLLELMREIAIWHGVKFIFTDTKIGDINLTVLMSKDTELNDLLKIVESVAGVKFINNGGGEYMVE